MTQRLEYRDIKAINNSIMGTYEDDYQSFVNYWVLNIEKKEKDRSYLTLGSIIDTLLTAPELYEERFHVFTGKVPTAPQMLAFCAKLAELYTIGMPLEGYFPLAYDTVGIKTPKLETFVERFIEFAPYFQTLIDGDKQVISLDDAKKAYNIVEQLRVNTFTSPIVNAVNTDKSEVFNQVEIYGIYKGIPIKGAVDRVLVSHNKKVIQPVDFKSSYNVPDFRDSYYKYRYYRQGSYYTYLLATWAKGKGWEDYKILPFTFVVCSTSGGQHWLYKMSKEDILAAQWGGETKWGMKIKGWEAILEEIVYLTEKRDWAFPYECLANNGIMELNIFK